MQIPKDYAISKKERTVFSEKIEKKTGHKMNIEFKAVKTAEDFQECLAIRAIVFIDEQDVPPDLELDGLDDAAMHVLCMADGKPAATARMRLTETGAKIERVAVLKDYRGLGIGKMMMEEVMKMAHGLKDRLGLEKIMVSAQEDVIYFYEKLGFSEKGPIYIDAGIPHKDMEIAI